MNYWQILEIGDCEELKMDVIKYFEEKVVPHIEPDQHVDSIAHENELVGFIDAVIDAVETGKMPKVATNCECASSVTIYVCMHTF